MNRYVVTLYSIDGYSTICETVDANSMNSAVALVRFKKIKHKKKYQWHEKSVVRIDDGIGKRNDD